MAQVQPPTERRKFYRHRISVPIKLRSEPQAAPARLNSQDISLGGISFLWARRLRKGNVIHLTIPVKEKSFEVAGKVAFCKEDRKTGCFRTGISFLDSNSEFKAKLAEEALEILEFRKKISQELGRDVSEEEAAKQWIQRYAEYFSSFF